MSDFVKDDNFFRNARKRTGVSIDVWADIIGSNRCSVYNFEQGKSRPRNKEIIKRIQCLTKLFDDLRKDNDYLIKNFYK